MVSFISLDVFVIAAVHFLGAKSNIFGHSETISIDLFLFFLNMGHTFFFLCIYHTFFVVEYWIF